MNQTKANRRAKKSKLGHSYAEPDLKGSPVSKFCMRSSFLSTNRNASQRIVLPFLFANGNVSIFVGAVKASWSTLQINAKADAGVTESFNIGILSVWVVFKFSHGWDHNKPWSITRRWKQSIRWQHPKQYLWQWALISSTNETNAAINMKEPINQCQLNSKHWIRRSEVLTKLFHPLNGWAALWIKAKVKESHMPRVTESQQSSYRY